MKSSTFRRAVLGALLVAGAAVAAPHASLPSVVAVGRAIDINGGGFTPGSVITVRLVGPGNAVSMSAVVISADGRLAHSLTAAKSGGYRVQLLNADGSEAAPAMTFQASR